MSLFRKYPEFSKFEKSPENHYRDSLINEGNTGTSWVQVPTMRTLWISLYHDLFVIVYFPETSVKLSHMPVLVCVVLVCSASLF